MMLGVRLSPQTQSRLDALAKDTNRSKSFYVKEAIELFLQHYENVYKDIGQYEREKKAGTVTGYSLEEIKKKYELD